MSFWRTVSVLPPKQLPSHAATPLTTTPSRSEDKHSNTPRTSGFFPLWQHSLIYNHTGEHMKKTHMHSQHHLVQAQALGLISKIKQISLMIVSPRACGDMPKSWVHSYYSHMITMRECHLGSSQGIKGITQEHTCRGHCVRWQGALDLFLCSFNVFPQGRSTHKTCSILALVCNGDYPNGIYFSLLGIHVGWPLFGCQNRGCRMLGYIMEKIS